MKRYHLETPPSPFGDYLVCERPLTEVHYVARTSYDGEFNAHRLHLQDTLT